MAEAVQKYLDQHEMRTKLEEAMNLLVKVQPQDPVGWLGEHFLAKSEVVPTIVKVVGREILDSRGNPTVETDVFVATKGRDCWMAGRGAAPSGASTGMNEALELRDCDKTRYGGKGTQKAATNVSTVLCEALKGKPLDQRMCDEAICKADGTELKKNVGGNAITATSFAVAEAIARVKQIPLWEHFSEVFKHPAGKKYRIPTPLCNVLNGGKHAGGNLKIQEFMIVPKNAPFKEQLRMAAEVYQALAKALVAKYGVSARNLGDEGGFAPAIQNPDEALCMLEEGIAAAGYKVNEDVFLAMDCASSEFYDDATKKYEIIKGKFLTAAELVDFYVKMVEKHPAIISIEDPMDEGDHEGWKIFMEKLGAKIQVVADDLTTTNPTYIKKAVEGKLANALLLKVNQIGSVSESMTACQMVYDAGWNCIVSHRSGEPATSIIADLGVAMTCKYIKTGAPARGERTAKLNRLLEIEEELAALGKLEMW